MRAMLLVFREEVSSLFGVGKKQNLEKDFESSEKNGPWAYIIVGLIMTILFIGTILFAVKLALS